MIGENLDIVNKLCIIGMILIFLGMVLQLEQVIVDNEKKQELIEKQADELIKCKAENEHLWNNYYENVSNDGEYYE